MKILLIVPPNFYNKGENYHITVPLGLAYIAAVLEKKHEVQILDSVIESPLPEKISKTMFRVGLEPAAIREKIKAFAPDVVGITSSYTVQQQSVFTCAETVKGLGDIPVIVGGANASALPEEILKNNKSIDYLVIGESEDSISDLIDCLEHNKDVSGIDGLGYRRENEICVNPKTNYREDLDALPFPARHLLPMEKYFQAGKEHALFSKRKPHTTIITSRGCPLKCVFCSIHSVWGRKWRARSANNVVDEIEELVNTYGIKEIHFEDDNLTVQKDRALEICDEILRRKLDITWTTPNGVYVGSLDEELLKKMKLAGCYRLFLGIESGNQYVLNKIIGKRASLKKIREVIAILKKLKISTTGFFVIGLPGETKENINETIDFMLKADFDHALLSIATPYPGTDLHKICQEENYITNPDISQLKPKFAAISTKEFTREEVVKLRNNGLVRFQLNKMIRHPVKYITSKDTYYTLWRYLKFFLNRIREFI